jgi:hypothetical protein
MENTKENIQKFFTIEMSNYVRPEIKEVQGKKWVLNGNNNSFYTTIIDAYNGSPTNSAIIDSYSQFIYGKGLISNEKVSKATQWNEVNSIFSKKDIRKICKDFEMFGESAIEVKYLGGKVRKCFHVPKQRIAPEVSDAKGNITGYWYSYDFSKTQKYPPIRFDAFGFGEGVAQRSEIYVIKDYQIGQFYYSNPSYLSGLSWAKFEEEFQNYCINHIKNGLSAGYIINVNGGVQESEIEIQKHVTKMRTDLSGSNNSGKFFINFNDGKDSEMTITATEVSEAHKQYEYLSAEARQQLMTAHKLTSPMLVGVKEASGFSSNAEEIKVGFIELMINVIQPKQEIILDGFMEILQVNGNTIQLDFESLRSKDVVKSEITNPNPIANPNQDIAVSDAKISYNGAQIASAIKVKEGVLTKEQAIVFLVQFLNIDTDVAKSLFTEAQAVTQLSSHKICCSKLPEDDEITLSECADGLIELGEVVDDEVWEEIDSIPIESEMKLTELTLKLARTFSSFPNASSEQDTDLFKIRYKYAGSSTGQREFCKKMISADKVYRKEDIELAGDKVVNKGFGPEGADTYSIWLYKGSVNCQHFWERKIYLRRTNESISVNDARKLILELDPTDRPESKWQVNDPLVSQPAQDSNNNFKLN